MLGSFLLRLEDAIQPLADSNEIMATASRLLSSYLQVSRCACAVVASDEDHFVITGDYVSNTFSIHGRFTMSAFGQAALALMRSGDVCVVDDVARDTRITAPRFDRLSRHGHRCSHQRAFAQAWPFVAGLAAHRRAVRHWTPGEIDWVRTVVNQCWETLERVHAQLDLADRQRQLVEADLRKDEFLAMLAHELKRELRNAGVAVRLAAESVVSMIERRSQEIKIAVPAKPVRIMADPACIAQALENPIVNASKYTPEHGAIRIEVENYAN